MYEQKKKKKTYISDHSKADHVGSTAVKKSVNFSVPTLP